MSYTGAVIYLSLEVQSGKRRVTQIGFWKKCNKRLPTKEWTEIRKPAKGVEALIYQ